jgi:hypothetical protein
MTDTPLIFREEQIKNFVLKMKEAATFTGPNNEPFIDEFIEAVLEEVQARESDLSTARVAIEKYVIGNLAKQPDDILMMRIHDNIQPIINEVIQIEIRMYGHPKYVVSKANNNAEAWSLEALKQNPITNIQLPQDVVEEVSKYNFTTVKEIPTLPDSEPNINDYRSSFFEELADGETEESWMEKFQEEKSFALIDICLYATNFYEQVSKAVTDQLREYVKQKRTEKELEYEKECPVPESEIEPGRFITAARNSSIRAFFTLLQITSDTKEDFIKHIEKNYDKLRELFDLDEETFTNGCVEEAFIERTIDAFINLYGKYPINTETLTTLKVVFDFFDQDQRNHFYKALNEQAMYYEERRFFESSKNCYLLVEYLADEYECGPKKDQEAQQEPSESDGEPTPSNSPNDPIGVYFE